MGGRDLSEIPTEELMRMRSAPAAASPPAAPAGGVDLSKVSTEDLMKMRAAPQDTQPVFRPSGDFSYQNPVLRQAGLGARAVAPTLAGAGTGAAIGTAIMSGPGTAVGAGVGAVAGTLAGPVSDAATWIYRSLRDLLTPKQLSDLVKGKTPDGPYPTEALEALLTKAGLPEPATPGERVGVDVARAMTGQGALMKGGELMAQSAKPVISRIGDLLRANPTAQTISAAGGSGAAGATREGGGGPVAQTLAGLAGGIAAPVAGDVTTTAAKAGVRGLRAAVDPFTQAGREKVVGSTLRRLATDPDQAIANIDAAQQPVAGSLPTTAQAARDEGLLITERGIQASNPQAGAQFGRRASEQNTARNAVLDAMAGDDAALAAARTAREESTGPMRTAALDSANTVGVSTDKLLRQIRGVESQPGIRASDVVSKSLTQLKEKITQFTNEDGFINAKDLYTIRKELGNIIRTNAEATQNWDKRLTGGLQIDMQRNIDDAIEAAGGAGWKEYLSSYATQSKPINQMETLQGVRTSVQNAGTDAASGERILSASKFANIVRNPEKMAELEKVLTKDQVANLRAISADLDRAATSASSGKSAGSNTTQNISTAYVLGQALGQDVAQNSVLRNLARPIQWLNQLNERELQELLTDAMLNPGTAKALMGKPTPQAVESLGHELAQRARALGIGGTAATATTLRQPEEKTKARPVQ